MKRKLGISLFLVIVLSLGVFSGVLACPPPPEDCDGDTYTTGLLVGDVNVSLEADNYTPWIYKDEGTSDTVHITGLVEVDIAALAYADAWGESWKDWEWKWLPSYQSTWAEAWAYADAFTDFWWWVEGTNPDGSSFYSDSGYTSSFSMDYDYDYDSDSDWWWLCFGNDIDASAAADALAYATTTVKIPIDITLVPKKPGVYIVEGYGDSFVDYFAASGFCTEVGCFDMDEEGNVIFIFDGDMLRILARVYPAVPTGRFDIHEAPDVKVQIYNIEGNALNPWNGGHSIYQMPTEDKGGGNYGVLAHVQDGTTAIIWSWTNAGHEVFGSYDIVTQMRMSGWQQDLWSTGDECWQGVGFLYCPKAPTVLLRNACPDNMVRDDFREAMWAGYGLQEELGRALTQAEWDLVVASVTN